MLAAQFTNCTKQLFTESESLMIGDARGICCMDRGKGKYNDCHRQSIWFHM